VRSPHAAEAAGFFAGVGAVIVLVAVLTWGDNHLAYATWLVAGALLSSAAVTSYAIVARRRPAPDPLS
jgi:hypothetical protein